MSVIDQLDELRERLESVADHLDNREYEQARDAANGISKIMDCPMCKQVENGVLGGVMFTIGINEHGREQRADIVAAEIRDFIRTDLAQAREAVEQMEEKMAPREP